MKKIRRIALLSGAVLTSLAGGVAVQAAQVLVDNYTAANAGTGFALGSGVNAGINPPTTRLSGSVAENLRYIQSDTAKAASAYAIASNRMRVQAATGAGRVTLSANGSSAFDFASAFGSLAATKEQPAIYEIGIKMDVDSGGTQRASFAISTVDGNNVNWDFGFQVHRVGTDDFYTISHRVDGNSSGTGADVTGAIHTTAPGTYGTEITLLMRITDAGPESIETADYNSRLQLSLDNGATWFYDTSLDSAILNQWRFDGANRFILWDIAPNGVVTYDSLSVNTVFTPTFAVKTWTGGGADDNWSTGANWDGTAPANGTGIVFAGTSRQANNNDITDLNVPFLALNNGGFSLSGNPLILDASITNAAGDNTISLNLSYAVAGTKQWSIASGSRLSLNNNTSVEILGDHVLSGGGTLLQTSLFDVGSATSVTPAFIIHEGQHVVDGGNFSSKGGYRIGSLATGPGAKTILTNNATLNLSLAGGNLRVGDSANPITAELQIHNSTLTMAGGSLGVSYAAGATALVTQIGGTVSGGIIAFNDAGAGSGTYTVKNGTLSPRQIREDTAAGASAIYFDNATLGAFPGANVAFFNGVDVAEIQSGGLVADVHTDVTIAQVLSGVGSLTKAGPATLTLSGNNTYSGNTIVQGGRLVMPTGVTNNAVVQVSDGAEFGVLATGLGSTRSLSTLNFAGASFNGLHVDLASFSSPSAPLLKVSSLALSGPVSVNVVNGLQLTTGQIVLIDYDGALSGGFNFTLSGLPAGVTANLVHNTANSSIDLNITGVPGYRWTGAVNGEWDYSTANWLNLQDNSAATYQDGFPIEFRDGAANPFINVAMFTTPAAVVVSNNSLNYVFNGGSITTPSFKKFGNASLTRTGGEIDSITNLELNAGSYVISNVFDATFSTALSDTSAGTGTLVKQGANTMTVNGNSISYDGAILIQDGVYKLAATNTLGSTAGATTVSPGATLDLNNIIAPHEPVIVSGSGFAGAGAITDTTTGGGVAHNLTDVTLLGHTTFGANGRWDIRIRSGSGPGPGLRGNGFDLTKIGPGAVSIASQRHFTTNQPYWEMNLGNVVINEGSITFAESVSLGNPSKTITVAAGASLGTYDLNYTNPIVRNVFLTDAAITGGGGASDTNLFTGTINLTGQASLRPADAKLVFNGPIVGNGNVTVLGTGAGALYLNGVNTYTGETVVSNGVFGGWGVIPGNLTMLAGTNAPGMGVGTLTVNGNATLAGSTIMELNRSLSPNSDRLVVGGSMNWAGTLRVVLAAGAPSPQAGDVYQLFNKAGSGSFSSIILPNISNLPGSLTWDTSNLTVDGTIKVNGTATPPTIGGSRIEGGNFIFSGTGGIEGATYYVLASTNVAAPVVSWTPVATNTFGAGGTFSYTNAVSPGLPATFYLLQLQ